MDVTCNYLLYISGRKWFQRYVFTAPKARRPMILHHKIKRSSLLLSLLYFQRGTPRRGELGDSHLFVPREFIMLSLWSLRIWGIRKGTHVTEWEITGFIQGLCGSMLNSLHRVFVKYHTQIFFQKKSILHSNSVHQQVAYCHQTKKQVSVGNNGWKWR